MITEKGTVKISTRVDEELTKESTKPVLGLGTVFLILGVMIILIGIVLSISVNSSGISPIPFAGIFFTIFGGSLIAGRSKNISHCKKWDIVNEYEFFSDRIELRQYVNGEVVITEKVYLSWLMNAKELKTFFRFGSAKTNGTALYFVRKEGANENELNIVRALLRLPLAPTAQIPPYPNPMQSKAQPTEQASMPITNAQAKQENDANPEEQKFDLKPEEKANDPGPAENEASNQADEQSAPKIKRINK